MGDKGSMFCAACGTVSMQEGNCPQCATPLRKLGRVGSINDSKRATQHMINKSGSGLPLDLQIIKRVPSGDSDSSASAFLTYRPHNSPRADKQNSPRQSPRFQATPVLVSPRLLAQAQLISSKQEGGPTTQEKAQEKDPVTSQAPETTDSQTSETNSERKSYLTAAINRVSQVFSWRNKEQKSPDESASRGGSSSVPDFTTYSLPHPSTLNGVRVLPPITRRRSSVDFGGRSQSSPYIPSSDSKRRDSLANPPKSPDSTRPALSNSGKLPNSIATDPTISSASLPDSPHTPRLTGRSPTYNIPSSSAINSTLMPVVPSSPTSSYATSTSTTPTSTPTSTSSSTSTTPINTPTTTTPSTPTSISPSITTGDNSNSTNGNFPDINSPRKDSTIALSSLINSPRSDDPKLSTKKPDRPHRPGKPNLTVIVNNDAGDSSSDESKQHSSKSKSSLSVSCNSLPKSNSAGSPALHALQKTRPLPTTPGVGGSSFNTSLQGGSPPNLASPRVHHTPPKRPLPATPTAKTDVHPHIHRRNTVHSDMHVASPYDSPSKKEVLPDWLSLVQTQKHAPPTPKGEVTVLPPTPKTEFFHPHITVPPRSLASDEMREKIALELIITEYEYVNDLYTLVCAKNELEKFIHKNELSSIFNNIDQIYKVNEAIYRKMIAYCMNGNKLRMDNSPVLEDALACPSADDKVTAIARTFLGMAHTMRIYVNYSLGHQRALEKLKVLSGADEYTAMIKEVEAMPGFKSTEISGFLIKPVQRICRYPLLLKEIVKSTPPGHHTLDELKEALDCVEQTLLEINNSQKSIERELNLMRAQQDLRLFGMDIDVMSPTRSLVLDGPMRLVPVIRKTSGSKVIKKPKEGHYFLFDDFFLFVMNTKKKETPHIFIPADQSLVTDPGDNALEIIHSGQQIWMFVLPSYHDKVFLMQKMNQIIEDNLQEARLRNGGTDKVGKSTLNIATLARSGKHKKKKKGLREFGDMFGGEK